MPSREGKKKKKNSFSFRGLLFWRRFFRRSRPFMQRDASKWPRSLQWSSAAPWLKMNFLFAVSLGPVAVCGNEKTEEFKVFFFCFIFGSLFVTAGLNKATWCCASFDFYACSFLRFPACYQLFIALELLSNCVNFMSDLLLQNNWAVVKKENTVRLQITKIITYFDQS